MTSKVYFWRFYDLFHMEKAFIRQVIYGKKFCIIDDDDGLIDDFPNINFVARSDDTIKNLGINDPQ